MDTLRFLVISPYRGLDEVISELLTQYDHVEADCFVANLQDADPLLEQIRLKNYDAVLSRGGTSQRISRMTGLPVFDLEPSALDALRAIRLAQNFRRKTAVVGFESITSVIQMLDELLDFQLDIHTVSSREENLTVLKELQKEGVRVVVCDTIGAELAPQFGLTPVMVASGYETIRSAFDHALEMLRRVPQASEADRLLEEAAACSPLDCTIFDARGSLLASTLSDQDPDHVLTYLSEHREELLQENASQLRRSLHGRSLRLWLSHTSHAGRELLYIFSEVEAQLDLPKTPAIRRLSAEDVEVDFSYYSSSHSVANTRDLLEKYSRAAGPVLITGETGTGKDLAARIMYALSSLRSSLFYQIDCESAAEKSWKYLLRSADSPLSGNRQVLYFRHIDSLPPDTLSQLLSFITDTNMAARNRLFFSCTMHKSSRSHDRAATELLRTLPCLSLFLPSLRERPDDLAFLSTLYINRFNPRLGRQIIGFDPRAIVALRRFPWQANLDQLQRIIRELMLITPGSYISYDDTMRILHQETSVWLSEEASGFQFDLSQPLDDIVRDILTVVLKEEGNNQSRTAERLGISRSTLWRMLKSRR